MANPYAGGTKGELEGVLNPVFTGGSELVTTTNFLIAIFLNAPRIILASGSSFVLKTSVIITFVGSKRFPAPIEEIIGI